MKRLLQISVMSITLALLAGPFALAQQEKPTRSADGDNSNDNTEAPAGQEVEINEDNYRQFMELKDARQRRGVLPEDAFKPRAGLQKLDKLPEESQKHLRNQLREIIVRGDQWQPGDESKSYPYVPSEAARTNRSLQKQEAEAWGELVDSYHKREAQIYANSARSQAAMASDSTSGDGSNSGKGSPGDGTGQPGSGEQAGEQGGQQSRGEPRSASEGYSPGDASNSNAKSTAGASQNAMEFLKGTGGQADETGEGGGAATSGDGGQGEQESLSAADGNDSQNKTVDIVPTDPSASTTAQKATGSSQNAMEYLQGAANQEGDQGEGLADAASQDSGEGDDQGESDRSFGQQDDKEQDQADTALPESVAGSDPGVAESESTAGAAQNALEYLAGDQQQAPPAQVMPAGTPSQQGTLTIQDLLNARGVNGGSGTPPPDTDAGEKPPPDDKVPDKDGDG
jgi:hypothetical protein